MANSKNPVTRFLAGTSWLWALAYFTLATVWMTYPMAAKMAGSVIGQAGDNIYFVWMIGWLKKALFDLHVNPFNVWFLNYPEGWSLAYTEITPIMLLIALPFSLLKGPVYGYNAAMLASFILSGFFMYLWIRRLTGRMDAGILAGTIFAFLPFRFAHLLIGHLNLSGTQWFPLYFMGLFDLLEVNRGSSHKRPWKNILLTGISLGLIALTSQYYLFMTLIISAFLVFCFGVFIEKRALRKGALWADLALAGLTALPLALLASAPFFMLLGQGGLPDRSLGNVRNYSANPTDFLLPFTGQAWFGKWVGAHFNREMWVEGSLYIGAVSAFLGILAFIKLKDLASGWILRLMLWGGAFALILALGTDLHWNGALLELPTPQFLMPLVKRETFPLLLPGFFLFKYFPLYAKLRALERFGIFVLVFSSAAAGFGCAWLVRWVRRSRELPTFVLLLALALADFYNGPFNQFEQVRARAVDGWLKQQPGSGVVIQFPFYQAEDQYQTYYTLVYDKPFVGGFFNAFPPRQYARVKPLLENFPDRQSLETMRELKVEYVVVDTGQYKSMPDLRKRCEELGLTYAVQMDNEMVFKLGQVK
jgi:uncharacterized membrane protein YozB (DUF420 family)